MPGNPLRWFAQPWTWYFKPLFYHDRLCHVEVLYNQMSVFVSMSLDLLHTCVYNMGSKGARTPQGRCFAYVCMSGMLDLARDHQDSTVNAVHSHCVQTWQVGNEGIWICLDHLVHVLMHRQTPIPSINATLDSAPDHRLKLSGRCRSGVEIWSFSI